MPGEMKIQIPRVKLGNQGFEVSKLGFGCNGLSGMYNSPLSDEEGISIIKYAFSKGITFFDTADVYGDNANELLVGKALKQLPREKVQLATKFGVVSAKPPHMIVNGTPEYVRSCCEASLKRLGVEYIDLYYQHKVDTSLPIEETMGELKKLVEEGKIKYIGLSEASPDTIRRAHAVHPITTIQMEWSLWTRDIEEEIVPLCRELGIGIVPYSPLGRGFFGGKAVVESLSPNSFLKFHPRFQGENLEKNKKLYTRIENLGKKHRCTPAQLALAWILQQGNDVVPIPGTTKIKNLDANINSLKLKLTEEDLKEISNAISMDEVVGGKSYGTMRHLEWKFANTPPQPKHSEIKGFNSMDKQQDLDDQFSSWGITRLIGTQMALRAGIELNVFNIIANSGHQAQLSSSEIVSKISTTNPDAAPALERILRMLSANSLLSISLRSRSINGETKQEKTYGLTAETRSLVSNGDGASSASMFLMSTEREIVESLYMLKDSVLEQGCVPFHKAHGMKVFEYNSNNPKFSRIFNDAMANTSKIFLDMVLKEYAGFEELKELMDIGGGNGASLKKIVSVYPHLHGINFDLPHVIADAPKYSDVEHVAGDMFESLPNAQTILLKWILHDWDDDHCMKLLSNCWKALPNNGKVIVVELVIPQVSENDTSAADAIAMDFFMMVLFPGGKERTTIEFDKLAKAAGFAETKFFPIGREIYVMEFIKTDMGEIVACN